MEPSVLDLLYMYGRWLLVVVPLFYAISKLIWWEFYAKPCRDSLKNIERALLAAPWMQPQSQQRLKRSA